jgi:predicted nucleic acid-binding protein
MTYLIDSDFTADYLDGYRRAVQVIDPLRSDGIAISLVTYGEIYEGIFGTADPKAAELVFQAWLRSVEVLPLTRPIMRRFAGIRADLRRQGNLIADSDLMIAATALHHNLTLVTRNRRHFARVPNLTLLP